MTRPKTETPEQPVIELVRSSYQPSKAELEEELTLPEWTAPEELARAVTRTVRVKWRARPEKPTK